MAPRDSSSRPSHRRRESSSTRHYRQSSHHERRSSRRPPTESDSEDSRPERRSRPHPLSAEALAQLNERNARAVPDRSQERRRHKDSRDHDFDARGVPDRSQERRRHRGSRDHDYDFDEDRRRRREERRRRYLEEKWRREEEERRRMAEEEDDDDDDDEVEEERRGYRRYTAYDDSPRRPRRTAYRPRGNYSDDDTEEEEEGRGYRRYNAYDDSPRRPRRAAHRHRGNYSDDDDENPRRRPPRVTKGNQRVVSGAALEEGQGWRLSGFLGRLRGGGGSSVPSYDREKERDESDYDPPRPVRNKKKKWIILGIAVVLLVVIIVVAVVVSRNNSSNDDEDEDSKSELDEEKKNTIPMQWRGTYLDPFSWKSTDDFNLTFTDEMVGGLPVMGLFTEWDDSARANEKVPPLDEEWGSYEEKPARGVNVGGWLSIEPFITPSLFDYDPRYGIVDEYTLCKHLGPRTTADVLEKHYASFVTESTFKEIRDAGLDHVRIPFSYWAVEVYEGDPYLFRTSWRYLLRAIEWCRKYGLRVKLDPHGIPGSQNGWNHSGRLGAIGWLNGTDGAENRRRSIEFHDRLSKFFAQDRYKNIIAFYGAANEPRMTELSSSEVIEWTEEVYKLVRDNGVRAPVVFGDGFMGLHNWQGRMTGYDDLVLDVHQYVIFNRDQIALSPKKKVEFACDEWTTQARQSMDRSTGYGPTMFAEWSQADSDCAPHLTNVGRGNRWTGTYDTGQESTSVLEPRCPALDDRCDCGPANADIKDMSDEYKRFLRMFAEAQMHSFEKGWGWWYWTWDTESAPLWSYKKALAAGIMPKKPWDRDFNCNGDVPNFGDLP